MKITYERLNQIIEEEVVKFKRLNEAGTPVDQATLDKLNKLLNDARTFGTVSKENANSVITALDPFKGP